MYDYDSGGYWGQDRLEVNYVDKQDESMLYVVDGEEGYHVKDNGVLVLATDAKIREYEKLVGLMPGTIKQKRMGL